MNLKLNTFLPRPVSLTVLLIALSTVFLTISCVSKEKYLGPRAKNIPVEDFFKNPASGQYKLSPDGSKLAYLKPYKNRLNIFVRDTLVPSSEWRLTSVTDRDIPQFFWKGNGRILFTRDFDGDENFHLFVADLASKKSIDVTPGKDVRVRVVDVLRDTSKNQILIATNKRNPVYFDVYRLNVKSGKSSMILRNPGKYTEFYTDNKGQVRIATATDGVNKTLFYRSSGSGGFRKLMTLDFKNSLRPVRFSKDNKRIYAISNLKRDKAALVLFDPRTRHEVTEIYKHPEVDVSNASFSNKTKELLAAHFITWKRERKFFEPRIEGIFQDLYAKLPEREIDIVSRNKNEDLFTVRTLSDRTMGDYYLYDSKTKKLDHLATLAPWLDESELAPMKAIKYQSRDGLTINGYLTLPKNSEGKNLPVIINPHGGPWHRDTWRFDPTVQFLTNRGYAVLQMNFRGSTGYGRKFWEASFKQWGLKMQDDVSDGVKWLVDTGVANKDRVCIYGGSYGGYTTLAALAFTPELYRCGIDYVGVSNLFTFLESIPPYWEPYRDMLYEMVGHPEKDKELLRTASPVFHVDKIVAPLFVAQGANDPRVKKQESDQMVAALKKRGIDVPYLVKDNEGHGFRNQENKFEFYHAMEKFLRKHM